jgi:aminomethyltransferase
MRTALYDRHIALEAKMGEFAGWEMPLYYKGAVAEHLAVRNAVGLFDVSHMGCIEIEGEDAARFLDHISTNAISGQPDQLAIYTVFSSEEGGCIDDAIVFCIEANHFLVVVNAGNREADWEHFQRMSKGLRVTLTSRYGTHGILALQGPQAKSVLTQVMRLEIPLKVMQVVPALFENEPIIVSRTGYTGSFGYELIIANSHIGALWDALLQQGADNGIQPAGLAARDTLRLEAGYALYGHELARDIAPTESISGWTVRWKKASFVGKEALLRLEGSSKKRWQHAVMLIEKGVPRSGCRVFKNGQPIGHVTSGSHSPCLNRGIAIIMVDQNLALGERVEVEVRNHRLEGQVVKLPFYH